ncbi:MAG: hypothetical protein ACRDQW_18810 [Haloechinothrix sp.]
MTEIYLIDEDAVEGNAPLLATVTNGKVVNRFGKTVGNGRYRGVIVNYDPDRIGSVNLVSGEVNRGAWPRTESLVGRVDPDGLISEFTPESDRWDRIGTVVHRRDPDPSDVAHTEEIFRCGGSGFTIAHRAALGPRLANQTDW